MAIDGVKGVRKKDTLTLSFHDGSIETVVTQVRPQNSSSTP